MEIRKTSRNVCKGTNVNVICFILFCLVCCASTAYADKVTLYNSDQITSSLPYCMEQDAYGYIWIGTMHGLNRYDGYNFIHYFYDGKDSTSISNNEIVTIFCDSEKRLWIGTNKGLCRYDYATNAFVRYRIPEYVPRISCMSQRKNGDLLIGTSGYGMYILQKGSDKVIRIKGQKKTSYDIFHERIFEDDKGNVWWATHLGTMTKAKITGDEIKKTTDYALPFGMCVQIIKTDNTGFHAFCEHGVARYEYATDKFADANYDTSALPFGTKIMSVCINEKGNIGIGTSNRGFFCIPAGTNKLINASENLGQDASSLEINDLLIDKDGNKTGIKTGIKVDFKNTVVIMTSNIGSEFLLDGISEDGEITENARAMVSAQLKGHFRPEFLNRLDEIIMFKPLTKDDISHIIVLLLDALNKRLEERELSIVLTDEATKTYRCKYCEMSLK